jgi:hypothetical protein
MFAAWVLSHSRFDQRPYIIIDYKGEKFLNSIENIRHARLDRKPPREPGLHIVHPVPAEENEIEDYMWQIWERGNTGIYIDEGHMLPNKDRGALAACLVQGRSKRIPMIMLVQRPAWTSRFTFSEADHYCIFHVQYPDDRKFLSGLLNKDLNKPLPQYHSHYHTVARHENFLLKPVPHPDRIRENIEARIKPRTFWA